MNKTEAQQMMTEMANESRNKPAVIGQPMGCSREIRGMNVYTVSGRWYINGKFYSKAKALAALGSAA